MRKAVRVCLGHVIMLIFVVSIFIIPVEGTSSVQEMTSIPSSPELTSTEQTAPTEVGGNIQSKWVEHQRGPTYIQYRNTTHPIERRAEFGHQFTWNGTTWAPYSIRQLNMGQYQVNISQTIYELNSQGVQTFTKNGTQIMSDAKWQIYQSNLAGGKETRLRLDKVTVTYHETTDYLLVNRTLTGAPEDGVLTEQYYFNEGMKVTANYTAARKGQYRMELQ